MTTQAEIHLHALQRFAPDASALYPIDAAAHLAGMPRHQVLVHCKHGLIAPRIDPEYGGYWFDSAAIRTLQRIAYLRSECGINLTGVQIILSLMNEVERLREVETTTAPE